MCVHVCSYSDPRKAAAECDTVSTEQLLKHKNHGRLWFKWRECSILRTVLNDLEHPVPVQCRGQENSLNSAEDL